MLFLFCAEAGQFITFCVKYILPFNEKVAFQLELVNARVCCFITTRERWQRYFFFFCSTLLAYLFTSLFPTFLCTIVWEHIQERCFHGSTSLLPKPYAVTLRQSILLQNSPEGATFSFIFFVAFDTMKTEEF